MLTDNWRTYPSKNQRDSVMHIAASMGGHIGGDVEDEEMSVGNIFK